MNDRNKNKLELIEHILRVPWCIRSRTQYHCYTAAVCVLVNDPYLYILLGCVHVHKAHGGVVYRRGEQNTVFGTLVGLTNRFKA